MNIFYKFPVTLYYEMPPLYKMDNYDRCFLETNSNPTYCLIRADMIPDKTSDLWKQIDDFSLSLGHFQHDKMTFGICVSTCQEMVHRTINATSFYAGVLTDQPLVHFQTTQVFKSHELYRENYNELLNICINIYLSKSYNLKAKSNLLYCDSANDIVEAEHTIDYWNLTFYVIAGAVVFMTTMACIFQTNSNVINSFSLSRNWQKLCKENASDLKFLNAIKFFIQVGVIHAHSVWGVLLSPVSNPEFFETKSYWSLVLIFGPTILSALYVFSIFLLTLKILAHHRSKSPLKPLHLFLATMGMRFARVSGVYAFMVLFQGLNIWPNVVSPMFKFHIHREMWGCRESWWTNLLYVNNIFKMSENVSYSLLNTLSISSTLLCRVCCKDGIWPTICKYS